MLKSVGEKNSVFKDILRDGSVMPAGIAIQAEGMTRTDIIALAVFIAAYSVAFALALRKEYRNKST